MRLINTKTLEMHEFLPADIPRYAILSHRWQEEEASFKQYSKRHKYPKIQQLKGFAKIEQFCRIARERQMKWAWIDTCCIDSRSSAELSEAINSMWQWYADAAECYIHLCDVHMQEDYPDVLAQVKRSEWFTRGWTLQELIAPRRRVFFTSAWMEIGFINFGQDALADGESSEDPTRVEHSSECLRHVVSRASKVPLLCLLGRSANSFNVGERISWSAGRKTSRPEDVAYSLMGILCVNMPLLYGEGGKKAFVRLQLELIKKSNDTSIFAWKYLSNAHEDITRGSGGLLATSPDCFAGFRCGRSQYHGHWSFAMFDQKLTLAPYAMTNRGLYLHVGAYRMHSRRPSWCCVLWCVPLSTQGHAIFLEHPVGLDPKRAPVSVKRTFLMGWGVVSHHGEFSLGRTRGAIPMIEDSQCLELCEFYVEQDFV